MQPISTRIFLGLITFVIFCSSPLLAATERRSALVIGNGAYSAGSLKNPVNDATDMATALKKVGFSVILKKNANHREMMESIEDFGNALKRGGVGLFYYAGHGVQVGGVNYLLPIGARINKEGDIRYEAVDVGRVLTEMENANNGLNIVLLDACRDNPYGKTFRSASRGLAIVTNAPTGTFISYSTGAGQVARDGTGRNSPYTKALLEHIVKPGLPISEVFMKVRSKVKQETGQVPWELTSLEGNFFFIPEKRSVTKVKDDAPSLRPAANDALDDENQKLEAEQRRLEQEKAALEKQKALAEKRRQLEEEKARLEAEKEAIRKAELEQKLANNQAKPINPLVGIWNMPNGEYYEFDAKGNVVKTTNSTKYPYGRGKYVLEGSKVSWDEDFGAGMIAYCQATIYGSTIYVEFTTTWNNKKESFTLTRK